MGDDHFLNLQPGTVVNGRYEIVKCLGTGSMGMVYACRHKELSGHLVAMKVLFSEVARDEVAAARFRNEIVASYGVNHPHVVRAYEYFKDGDLVAFTMEFVGGGDLADRISEAESIPIPEIMHMLIQMCSGVQAIHDAGIIHRDLKPENILITNNGDIKITDFGIARTGTGPKLTEYGGVVGTIDYVSPEYLEKGQVDTRSDIYSLGVLAYEMITGSSPFKGKSVIETMTMRLRTDPELPQEKRRDCPEGLAKIVMRALDRDPERRYQAAHQMIQELIEIYELREGSKVYDPIVNPVAGGAQAIAAQQGLVSEAELALVTRGPSPLEQSTALNPRISDLDLEEDLAADGSSRSFQSSLDSALSNSAPAGSKNLAGTVCLDSASVEQIKEDFENPGPLDGETEVEDEGFKPYQPLRDVLPEPRSLADRSREILTKEGGPKTNISSTGLGSDRLRELSSEMYSSNPEGFFKILLKLFFLILLGFCAGVVLLPLITSLFGLTDGSEQHVLGGSTPNLGTTEYRYSDSEN